MKTYRYLLWLSAIALFSIFSLAFYWNKSGESRHDGHPSHSAESSSEFTEGRTVTVSPGDTLDIKSFGADFSYDITRINAKAGSELTLRYINSSDMPHNIILVGSEADIQIVGIAALQAFQNDYIPMNEENRMLAWTELARPGETVKVTFTIPEPGVYPYICTYPGHFTMMQGRLHSTE